MASNVRLNLYFPPQIAELIDATAERMDLSRPAVIRRALGIMQAIDMETQGGRYVGATRDRAALETVIVMPV